MNGKLLTAAEVVAQFRQHISRRPVPTEADVQPLVDFVNALLSLPDPLFAGRTCLPLIERVAKSFARAADDLAELMNHLPPDEREEFRPTLAAVKKIAEDCAPPPREHGRPFSSMPAAARIYAKKAAECLKRAGWNNPSLTKDTGPVSAVVSWILSREGRPISTEAIGRALRRRR